MPANHKDSATPPVTAAVPPAVSTAGGVVGPIGAPPRFKKIQVNFDEDALRDLESIRRAHGSPTLSAAIRDCVSLMNWARKEVAQGYKVGAFREGSPPREVIVCTHAAEVDE